MVRAMLLVMGLGSLLTLGVQGLLSRVWYSTLPADALQYRVPQTDGSWIACDTQTSRLNEYLKQDLFVCVPVKLWQHWLFQAENYVERQDAARAAERAARAAEPLAVASATETSPATTANYVFAAAFIVLFLGVPAVFVVWDTRRFYGWRRNARYLPPLKPWI